MARSLLISLRRSGETRNFVLREVQYCGVQVPSKHCFHLQNIKLCRNVSFFRWSAQGLLSSARLCAGHVFFCINFQRKGLVRYAQMNRGRTGYQWPALFSLEAQKSFRFQIQHFQVFQMLVGRLVPRPMRARQMFCSLGCTTPFKSCTRGGHGGLRPP